MSIVHATAFVDLGGFFTLSLSPYSGNVSCDNIRFLPGCLWNSMNEKYEALHFIFHVVFSRPLWLIRLICSQA